VGNACDSVVTFIVTEPPAVTAVFSQTMTCNGQCSGIATVFVGGGCSGNVCPYNYTWTNVTTTTTITGSVDSILAFPDLCPGDYTFSATDQIGCPPGTANVTILEATPLVPTITLSTNASCPSVCDGLTNSTAAGSVPPYTYSWDDPANQTTADATGLCGSVAGITYTLTVTDSLGCTETESVAIQEPEPITATFATTDPSCGGTCDGSAVISNPAGGTAAYTYSWSSGQTSSTVINALCAGSGSVTITDARDCDTTIDFTLVQPPGLEGTVVAFSDCDAAGNLIATATANPTSGTGPYTYLWDDAASQSTQIAVGLTVGQTYNVIVLDANGCRLDATTTIPIALCDLVIPNTFSPNDDSFNDTWIIENLINYTQAKLKVYNRWGDIVFTSTGYDTPWEGKSVGANLPAAVYYYVLDVPELDKNYAGQVTIVR
jgi:gliding motility-associated-like protein